MRTITVALLLVLTGTALAQTTTQTVRDTMGRTTGSSTTDTRGVTTFRDPQGRETGRAVTDRNGTTTTYDAMGRQTGTIRSK